MTSLPIFDNPANHSKRELFYFDGCIFGAVYYLESIDPFRLHKDFFAGLNSKQFLVIYRCEQPESSFLIITPFAEVVNRIIRRFEINILAGFIPEDGLCFYGNEMYALSSN